MSSSVYFELMSAGQRLATVSVRRVSGLSNKFGTPTWAYEVRYADKAPQRGTFNYLDTEELGVVSRALDCYFSDHAASVSS